jgi:hypothetical protein
LKIRLTALLVAGALMTAFVAPSIAQASPATTVPVTGTCQLASGEQGTFAGTFEVTRFVVRQGQLFARGVLTGTCTGNTTGTVQNVTRTVLIPVNIGQSSGTCEILNLVLGPVHLELLGLIVDLNQVVLTITAEQGPGNLLGNLLCAIAGLLDQPAPTPNALARILNRILAILG